MVATVKFSLLNYLYKFVLVTILVAVIIIEVMSKFYMYAYIYSIFEVLIFNQL